MFFTKPIEGRLLNLMTSNHQKKKERRNEEERRKNNHTEVVAEEELDQCDWRRNQLVAAIVRNQI
jgi:hypothetical protein